MDGLELPIPVAGLVTAPGMPGEAPVPMPVQRLDAFLRENRRPFFAAASRSRLWPRIAVFGGTLALAAVGIVGMAKTLSAGTDTPLTLLVLFLFSLNFTWIAFTFVVALVGMIVVLARRPRRSRQLPLAGRTAVLMPVHNEQPEHIFAAMEAMARGIVRRGEGRAFDWFVLSDTTDAAIALAEETAFLDLRRRLAPDTRAYYRRRRRNSHRKAGNIGDFCRRWGGAYEYLLVLDADSLMEPEAILELARRMEADPDAGIIQTVPSLINGRTTLARIQQFANRVYGPILAAGLAWWCQAEGNYWGHNAIIRRRAFTEAAGLPVLSGPPPFGGHVLSHDFVEAALIRRAGYTVRIADDIVGSYEEAPASLIDLATRDRRWCQGNLQHGRILLTRGLHWVSRFHLLNGIAAYASSLLWLLLIVAGLALSLQVQFIRPNYFQEVGPDGFPVFRAIDAELALRVFILTTGVLFAPKLFGFLAILFDRDARRGFGGGWRLFASTLFETVVSALIAPIAMVVQSWTIVSILSGQDSGWKPQRRQNGSVVVRDLVRFHRWHVAFGLVMAGLAWAISPAALAWLSPAVIGLLAAIPVSGITASPRIGTRVRRVGLLHTPAEKVRPAIARKALAVRRPHRLAVAAAPDFRSLIKDNGRRLAHLALVDRAHAHARGDIDPVEAVATAKIRDAQTLDEALSYLGPEERAITLASPSLVERLGEMGAEQTAA
jgi:membrane glycosyltransferase